MKIEEKKKSGKKTNGEFSWGLLLFALLFIATGVCLVAFPEQALSKVILSIGIISVVFAIVTATLALAARKYDGTFFLRLLGAICALFAGIFLLVKRNDDALGLLSAFIGLIIIVDGSFKLHTSVLSRRYKVPMWWIMLIWATVCVAGGFYVVKFLPSWAQNVRLVSIITGIVTILDGVQNFAAAFYSRSVEKRRKEEILASEKTES